MRQLGLMAQEYDLIIAYEAPSWGMHISTWQQVHEIITIVNLPNVRHCLDTFHISSKEAADPFNHTSPVRPDGVERLQKSLEELKRTVDPSAIGYVQLSDATAADIEQKGYPLADKKQPPLMTLSRNCRIFPCEPQYGGVLPALDVARTILNDIGYRGWVSMEVFHTDLWDKRPTYVDS